MELSLNLFWLLLVVVSVVAWRRQGSPRHRPQGARGSRHGLITLGCLLALLFPVISITDDLHAEQAIIEDLNPSKRAVRSSGGGHPAPSLGTIGYAALPGILPAPATKGVWILVLPSKARLASSAPADSSAGRAPPRRYH
jgi:hypothetical protein